MNFKSLKNESQDYNETKMDCGNTCSNQKLASTTPIRN